MLDIIFMVHDTVGIPGLISEMWLKELQCSLLQKRNDLLTSKRYGTELVK